MTKFKVGDKVRVIDVSKIGGGYVSYENGMETEVLRIDSYGDTYLRNVRGGEGVQLTPDELRAIEFIESAPPKQTKSQRISALEAEVQRLHERLADLERKPSEDKANNPALTPNEQRKAIIAEAKAFVAELQGYLSKGNADRTQGNHTYQEAIVYAKFHVNADKRAVTALVHSEYDNRLLEKAVAKAHPDDVFNADIGKAIALGRALGLDVTRFEKAVQPTEYVRGQVVTYPKHDGSEWHMAKKFTIENVNNKCSILRKLFGDNSESYGGDMTRGIEYEDEGTNSLPVVDDTEAQY